MNIIKQTVNHIIAFNFCSGKSVFLISSIPSTDIVSYFQRMISKLLLNVFFFIVMFEKGELPLNSIDRHLRFITLCLFLP